MLEAALDSPRRPTTREAPVETVRVVHEHKIKVTVVRDREPASDSGILIDGGDLKNETQYQRINREFLAEHGRLPLMVEVAGIIMDETHSQS